MQLFYTEDWDGSLGFLPETEAKHCLRALRLRTGDRIQVTDGNGNLYTGRLLDTSDRKCPFAVENVQRMPEAFPFRLHMAVAPTKNPDRFEWFVEKAVEIGVTEITALQCAHSERSSIKADRIRRLMVSAMKQSLHFQLPLFHEGIEAKSFLQQHATLEEQKFIAYCGSDTVNPPLGKVCRPGGDILVMIGPEGDFSHEEIQMAQHCGFSTVSLGNSRLRTETAAVVACTTIHVIHA